MFQRAFRKSLSGFTTLFVLFPAAARTRIISANLGLGTFDRFLRAGTARAMVMTMAFFMSKGIAFHKIPRMILGILPEL